VRRTDADGSLHERILVRIDPDRPSPEAAARLVHEFELRNSLDDTWALKPQELFQQHGQTTIALSAYEGDPLHRLVGRPMELEQVLRLGIALLVAVGQMHRRGLIHKDIKPANVFAGTLDDVRLTGFGIASRLPRERQMIRPAEVIAGTLPYMAPEQTGRMNRSIDSRSDLYSTGVVLYELVTGSLPFQASDPMEWVHCHVARSPLPPRERAPATPAIVSAIILRLLAKTPEDRYATAAGAEHDLRRCLRELSATGDIGAFALGERDRPDRLVIPEKLYGRAPEVEVLVSTLANVASTGTTTFVLVAGYPGVGKSAVVNELHRAMVPANGFFASGKLDQDQAAIPYSAFAQAFQGLVRMLLGKPEAELIPWRTALTEALGPNASLMLELVPELRHIVGEHPSVVDLALQDAQRRFQMVVRRFIGVFARAEHPLTLVLDDLQWIDAATLDLLENLLNATDLHHLFLVGAYRDNEVGPAHPLASRCDAFRQGKTIRTLSLQPLGMDDLSLLIADSLRTSPEFSLPLAELVHRKTGGNPFFAIQFLNELVDEGLLTFDPATANWSWDEPRSISKGYSENVADLMARRLGRLPGDTLQVLQHLACIGHASELGTLESVRADARAELEATLLPALQQELVVVAGDECSFVHDRVQQAAYLLIPAETRAQLHLDIGRRLLSGTPVERQKERVFEIVHQLNRGAQLITEPAEQAQLARLNLIAGQRSKASAAYASALEYFRAGAALCPDDASAWCQELTFSLSLERSECDFLTGDLESAEARLAILSTRAASPLQRAAIANLRIDVYTALDKADRAIEVCLAYLGETGGEWMPHPSSEDVQQAWLQVKSMLGDREIEDIVDLPLMTSPESIATMEVMTKAQVPASLIDVNLFSLLLWRMVALSLEHGNTDASCQAYVHIGRIARRSLDDPSLGRRFARVGYDLVERRGLKRFQARTYLTYAALSVEWEHLRNVRTLIRRAFDAANEIGDLTYAAFSCHHLISNLLASGDPLADVQREAERCLAFSKGARFSLESDILATQLALIRMLRGESAKFGCLDGPEFDEAIFEQRLAGDARLSFVASWYWIRKLQARLLGGDYATAVDAAGQAKQLMAIAPSPLRTAEFRFHEALSQSAMSGDAVQADQQHVHVSLASHHDDLIQQAATCPENFADRAALLGAEIARIEGRDLDAQRLYETAIRAARDSGFNHQQALAAELAARFYAARDFETIARAYLREARQAYLQWGAGAKVRQLDALHPHLQQPQPLSLSSTIAAPLDQLDLATVIKVSQRVSNEIVLEDLIDTIMRAAIEQAGAERGLLILARGDTYRVEAEATISSDAVAVSLRQEDVEYARLPKSVFYYVARTLESVLLDDASVNGPFAADPYLRSSKSRSVLCLPLINKAKLLGVLYLENSLGTHVFSPSRTSMLRLIASVAAVSIENGQLYRDLLERDAKVRRLFSANIIGIFTWHLDGRILDANDAFLRIVGFGDDDLKAGRMRWKDLMPSEWNPSDDRIMEEMLSTGVVSPFEGQYVRKDGSRVQVMIGAALFDATPTEGVSFVLDLTDQKRAEEMARDSMQRYHDVQLRLSDANRVASIGQLSASIAHEVNQPLAGILANAGACLHMLAASPPDVGGALDTARRTIRDVNRATEVIKRLRALFSRNPSEPELFDFNDAVREVIDMSSSHLRMTGVDLETRFTTELPPVMGDRVQLQQVIMNLMRNAMDAMREVDRPHRQIVVATERIEDGLIRISVTDRGRGLDPESMDKLFEPFYTTKHDGMGIGLSLSRSIVERHLGRLWAAQNQGPGATFFFTLPINPEDPQQQISDRNDAGSDRTGHEDG
jgi:PAS domain S-box-containing protein